MPLSDTEPRPSEGQGLAVAAQSLYLVNLLLVPGIAFLILLVLYFRHRDSAPALARGHLRQTLAASLWAGLLLVLVNGLILWLGGYDQASTWVVLLLYFTTCHATLVLLGVVGLARAMAGKPYRFPVIGPHLPAGN
jgi:uncharacterized membrane protein